MHAKKLVWIIVVCLAMAAAIAVWRIVSAGAGTEPARSVTRGQVKLPAHVPAVSAVERTVAETPNQPPGKEPEPPAVVTPPVAAAAAPVEQQKKKDVPPAIARYVDTSIPVETLMSEVIDLGIKGDAESVRVLKELGSADTYLNYIAIEALGNVKSRDVADYLVSRTEDLDPRIVQYAVLSLAKVDGANAVAVISKVLAANRQRPDGYQDMVCAACVDALAEIGSPAAVPALSAEFRATVGKTLHHDYGSRVVNAMKTIKDHSAIPALEAYKDVLGKQKDGMTNNPMGRRYIEDRMAEVDDAISAIAGETREKSL